VIDSAVHVHVRVGSERYALPVENVLEVDRLGEIAPVPGAGGASLGVRSHHGRVLPVFDLAGVFGIPREGVPQRIVVAADAGRRAGLAIDEVIDVGPLPEVTEESVSRFLSGSTLADGKVVGIVNVRGVLDALESGDA
jgi:purine-binding chemotaxis protein CheW